MRLLLASALLLALAACGRPDAARTASPGGGGAGAATDARLAGTVTYRERVALPPGATVIVSLRERGDATRTLSRTAFEAGGRQVPLPFELDVPGLDPDRRYVVEARIEADGRTMWATHEPAAVLPDGAASDGVELVLARSVAGEPASPEPYARARQEGVTFRGVGQEPGWLLDVYGDAAAPDSLVYQAHYATERYAFSDVTREASGEAVTYRADGLEAVVRDRPCQDAMSGQPFPAAVSVRHASGDVEGCGRPLD